MSWAVTIAAGASAVGAGVSAYGASKAGETDPVPRPLDIFKLGTTGSRAGTSLAGRQATGYLDYLRQSVPGFIALQDQLGPQLMAQGLGQGQQYLSGTDGQMGLLGLSKLAGMGTGQNLTDLRAAELAQMTGQANLTRGLLAGLSPEQASAVQQAQMEADRATASAQGVTPEEQRMYQQTAREAAQASGRLGGNSAIAAEVMGRENVLAQKRREAENARTRSYAMAGEFYTNPGLRLLSAAPQSYVAGTGLLSSALQAGPATSGQFDFNAPINFAQQRAGALNQANMAQYSANAQSQANQAAMYSQIGSGLMSAGMSGMGGGFGTSMGNFGSFASSGQGGNAMTAAGNMGRSFLGQPLQAYTV